MYLVLEVEGRASSKKGSDPISEEFVVKTAKELGVSPESLSDTVAKHGWKAANEKLSVLRGASEEFRNNP